jgi:MAP/microtubule affinity-regulating kinase
MSRLVLSKSKVADFGFANNFTPGTQLNTWCGSPPYAAPELFQGKEYAGPEVDVWSLGVVLYVLICGSLPFDGSTLPKLRARVIAGKFKVPFYMSPDCERLVKRMLTLDPLKRATLQQVMDDKWYVEGYENEAAPAHPSGLVLTPAQHDEILKELENIGMDPERAAQSVKDGSYDSHAATYYLIADKRFRVKPATNSNPPFKEQPAHKRAATTQPAALAAAPAKKNSSPLDEEEGKDTKKVDSSSTTAARGQPKARRATVGVSGPSSDQLRNEINAAPTKSKEALPSPRVPVAAPRQGSARKATSPSGLEQKHPQSATIPPAQPTALPPISRRLTVTSEDVSAPISLSDAKKQIQGDAARFTVSLATTTMRDPLEVHADLLKILKSEGIKHTTSPVITCKVDALEFELKVVKMPNLAVYCLRFKRLSGSSWDYKEVLSNLISKLNLQE